MSPTDDYQTTDPRISGNRRRTVVIVVGVVAVIVVAVLAFGVFGVQTLFIDKKVDEAAPVFGESSAAAQPTEAPSPNDAPTPATAPPVTDDVPPAVTGPAAAAPTAAPAPADSSAAGTITTVAQGAFSGADASHDVSGTAIVLTDGGPQRFLRFEEFEATNGPDLKVYLRAADGEFVSLGDLKGNIGSQNYEIPTEVDLSVYSTVQIWCQRFSVSFGQAELA